MTSDIDKLVERLNAIVTYPSTMYYAKLPVDLTREETFKAVSELGLKDQDVDSELRWYDEEFRPTEKGNCLFFMARHDGELHFAVISLETLVFDFI